MIEYDGQPKGTPEWGYRLNFSPEPTDILHDFCGQHDIAGASCPNCKKPLLRLLSLYAKDGRLHINPDSTPVVHLLYCWTCSIPFGEFSYRLGADGSVELLKVPARYQYEHGPEGPYDGYTGIFQNRRVSLQPMSAEEQQRLEQRFVDDSVDVDPSEWHQVGGYPVINNPSKTSCPLCSSDMPLLAVICDDATGNHPFGVSPQDSFSGNGGVQMVFQFCRKCSVVSAYHSCD